MLSAHARLGPGRPGQLRGETTVLGPQLSQPLPSFLGSLTGMLISGNFPGGFCDVGICPLKMAWNHKSI